MLAIYGEISVFAKFSLLKSNGFRKIIFLADFYLKTVEIFKSSHFREKIFFSKNDNFCF
jgi:hypothetical protein